MIRVQATHVGAVASMLLWLCPLHAARDANLVQNGSFERDADRDGMADGWQFAGDQGVKATWARDEGFAGRHSQKVACTEFTSSSPASHVMLCQLDTLRLEKGRWYRISFAARQQAIPGGAVHVAVSNTKAWSNCGLSESFRAAQAWKTFAFTFRATETISDRIRLQFWYTTTGTLWLDDVRVEPSEPVKKRFTEVVPPTTGANLLPNSSFECGASGWGSIADLPGWGGNLNLLVGSVDRSARMFHHASFKIALTPETMPVFFFDYYPLYRVPVKVPLLANRGWINVTPGDEYTLSAYMKADAEGLAGVLSVRQAFRGTLRRAVSLTTTWQRCRYTFRPQSDQVFVALGLDLEASGQEAGTVWIDAVQLEKGPSATAYKPGNAVEVGVETGQLGNLFPHGSAPEMTATVFNAGDAARSVDLRARVTDFDDAVVDEIDLGADVAPGACAAVRLKPGVEKRGFYRLHLESKAASVVLNRPLRFAVVTPYAHADSLFGMNHAYPWPHLLDLSRSIGLGWVRDWSLKWHDVEPEKGRFEFSECDRQIDRVLERGLKVLPLLPFPSARWSSSAEPGIAEGDPASRERVAYMPRDLDEFAAYVRATVGHYRGRLSVWEILNEPVYTSYALPRGKGYQVADYVRLLQIAYQAVKAADGDAIVVGGIAGGPTTYTREFIEAGGLAWVDVLNLHAYPGLKAPDAFEQPLRQLRRRMRQAGADKPIWFTEGAYYADDDMSYEPYESTWLTPVTSEVEAAEWQVKFNTLLLACGAEKIIYHSGTPGSLNNESLSGIFFEWAAAPRKMLATQAAMANLLVPPVRSLELPVAPDHLKAYGFESYRRTVIVAWAAEGAGPVTVSWTKGTWKAVDLLGNELDVTHLAITQRPVYLVSQKSKPGMVPW
ncbi:MAG: carbohydrate binding domain-containing protein [Sedimentisphaerales bacterium]|nr:carbohydrate binding domain-containing protein [Sedimentisphaerales bacterium]